MIKNKVLLVFVFSLLGLGFVTDIEDNNYRLLNKVYADSFPLDSAKIELGKRLFYDPIVSADSSTSCASCHSPYSAFAHTDHALSHGIHDSIGFRNAPALFNLAWSENFMWDGAINHLEVQALAPIAHPGEMASSLAEVVGRLQRHSEYPDLFRSVYEKDSITGKSFLNALYTFQLSLLSFDSRYDKMRRKELIFTEKEQSGYAIFQEHCSTCHTEPLFTNYDFANNGLPIDTSIGDIGRAKITGKAADSFLFKTPSLRNLSYTFPYMHDGRYTDLYQVLDHYNTIRVDQNYLSEKLRTALKLSSKDKTDLIVFLKTLDDSNFVWDKKNIYIPN